MDYMNALIYYLKQYYFSLIEKKVKIPKKKYFTLNGKIPVKYWLSNDSYGENKPCIYTKKQVDLFLKGIKNNKTYYYGNTDIWLKLALKKYLKKDKSIAIMGSVVPLYESFALYFGCKPTTIEYNKIISKDKRLKFIRVKDLEKNSKKFDYAFSISSFEHDGLGRYGDPINPNGDLEAMKNMKKILKKDGLFFLSIPVGSDKLVWNVHRIYGKIRLPLLLKGWEVIDSFGFSKKLYNKFDFNGRRTIQPIFVLKSK